jgi:hypothetical protein
MSSDDGCTNGSTASIAARSPEEPTAAAAHNRVVRRRDSSFRSNRRLVRRESLSCDVGAARFPATTLAAPWSAPVDICRSPRPCLASALGCRMLDEDGGQRGTFEPKNGWGFNVRVLLTIRLEH